MPGTIDHVNVDLKIDAMLLSALDLSSAQDPLLLTILSRLSNGTGTGQASQVWHDTRTLTASATENLDLAGVLTNTFGATLTFTKIKFVFVRAAAGNTNEVQVTRGSANGAPLFMANGDGISLAAGEWFAFFGSIGKTITPGTGDILTVTNSAGGTSVSYDIIIVGTD